MSKILLRISFIIALIIAIVLIAIVIIRFTPSFFSYLSNASASLFNVFKKEPLEVTSSSQIVISGNRVTLTWPADTQESVSLNYACNDNYTISYLGGNNTEMPIKCGTAFQLGGKTSSATIVPKLNSNVAFGDAEISVDQVKSNNKRASGTSMLTITNGSVQDTNTNTQASSTKPSLNSTNDTTKPVTNTNKPKPSNHITHTVSGPANLTISDINYVYGNGPAVQFYVTNNGGTNSGAWELQATLPNGDTFNSGILAGIPAGASPLFTLNLGTLTSGSNTVKITIDSNNNVFESNENDNYREKTFKGSNGTSTNTTSGKADLSARLISIRDAGRDAVAVRFEIRNTGGSTAKDWRFEAELPTDDDQLFRSDEQPDLDSGESMEYTLEFDNLESNGYMTIEVDSDDDVNESNESNGLRFRVTN